MTTDSVDKWENVKNRQLAKKDTKMALKHIKKGQSLS